VRVEVILSARRVCARLWASDWLLCSSCWNVLVAVASCQRVAE